MFRSKRNSCSSGVRSPESDWNEKAIHFELRLRNVLLSLSSERFEITNISDLISVTLPFVINYGLEINQY